MPCVKPMKIPEEELGVIRFLKTGTPKEDLATTLRVLREFKDLESAMEWVMIDFAAWAKLEQLEEFLDHLVNGAALQSDTQLVLKALEESQ